MRARYRFVVRFRLDPASGVSVDPAEFETQLRYEAATPGEEGWMFFRDHLWRGEVASPAHLRSVAAESIDVDVVGVEFRAFETDHDYLTALKSAIGESLDEFRAESVEEVLSKYLGSRLEVRPEGI